MSQRRGFRGAVEVFDLGSVADFEVVVLAFCSRVFVRDPLIDATPSEWPRSTMKGRGMMSQDISA